MYLIKFNEELTNFKQKGFILVPFTQKDLTRENLVSWDQAPHDLIGLTIITHEGFYNKNEQLTPLSLTGYTKLAFKTNKFIETKGNIELNPYNNQADHLKSLGAGLAIQGMFTNLFKSHEYDYVLLALGYRGKGKDIDEVLKNGSLFFSLEPYIDIINKNIEDEQHNNVTSSTSTSTSSLH